jgi:hypothetical protein
MTARAWGNRLQLGPTVGYTDHQSTRIWIRVFDDPANYVLRIQGRGLFPFVSTEDGQLEFGTAIAFANGLLADRRYRYQVLRYGRVVGDSTGSFRTMPAPGSMAEITFIALSCNHHAEDGAWEQLAAFVKENEPAFLLMLGDNVYIDKDPNVWKEHYGSRSAKRRQAIAEQYQKNWSRDLVQYVLANIPTYMVWDDHEIRDGWGSFAADSPTLAERYERGMRIFEKYNAYFEDARDVYWHFQMTHNPPFAVNHLTPPATPGPLPMSARPISGTRVAMPFAFQCGRVAVLVTDSRGDRDVWRTTFPVLGQPQWDFVNEVFSTLDASFDTLVVVTTVPIVCMDPDGQTQFLIGRRTDDVEYFKAGNEQGLWELQDTGEENLVNLGEAAIGGYLASRFGVNANLGIFKVKSIDDARDQWSNYLSRAEQEQLLRASVAAAFANRPSRDHRALLFIGGDLHSGGLYDIDVSRPELRASCLITSGISQRNIPTSKEPHLGTIVDENYEVAPGIHTTLQEFINGYNFAAVRVVPTGSTAEVIPTVMHEGVSAAWGMKAKIPLPG